MSGLLGLPAVSVEGDAAGDLGEGGVAPGRGRGLSLGRGEHASDDHDLRVAHSLGERIPLTDGVGSRSKDPDARPVVTSEGSVVVHAVPGVDGGPAPRVVRWSAQLDALLDAYLLVRGQVDPHRCAAVAANAARQAGHAQRSRRRHSRRYPVCRSELTIK